MGFELRKATKKDVPLKLALMGPSGSGKTYTSLRIASELGKRIAFIDTEDRSSELYADEFNFDVGQLHDYTPQSFVAAIKSIEAAGYDVLVIDSISHEWNACLELVDKAMERSKSSNSFTAWRDITPLHTEFIKTILASKMHIIATMRSKTEYAIDKDSNGKLAPRKIGLAPIQRDQTEYEFHIIGEMTPENKLIVGKTRCKALSGKVFDKPGKEFANVIKDWLGSTDAAKQTEEMEAKIELAGAQKAPALETITSAEQARLWKIAQDTGYDKDTVKALLSDFGINSFKEIPVLEKGKIEQLLKDKIELTKIMVRLA